MGSAARRACSRRSPRRPWWRSKCLRRLAQDTRVVTVSQGFDSARGHLGALLDAGHAPARADAPGQVTKDRTSAARDVEHGFAGPECEQIGRAQVNLANARRRVLVPRCQSRISRQSSCPFRLGAKVGQPCGPVSACAHRFPPIMSWHESIMPAMPPMAARSMFGMEDSADGRSGTAFPAV